MAQLTTKFFIFISIFCVLSVSHIPDFKFPDDQKNTRAETSAHQSGNHKVRTSHAERDSNSVSGYPGRNTANTDLPLHTTTRSINIPDSSNFFLSYPSQHQPRNVLLEKTEESKLKTDVGALRLPRKTKHSKLETAMSESKSEPMKESPELIQSYTNHRTHVTVTERQSRTPEERTPTQDGTNVIERPEDRPADFDTEKTESPGRYPFLTQPAKNMLSPLQYSPQNSYYKLSTTPHRKLEGHQIGNKLQHRLKLKEGKPIKNSAETFEVKRSLPFESKQDIYNSSNLHDKVSPNQKRPQKPKQMVFSKESVSDEQHLAKTEFDAAINVVKTQSVDLDIQPVTTITVQSARHYPHHDKVQGKCTDGDCDHSGASFHNTFPENIRQKQYKPSNSSDASPSLIMRENGKESPRLITEKNDREDQNLITTMKDNEVHLQTNDRWHPTVSQRVRPNYPKTAKFSQLHSKDFPGILLHEHSNDDSKQKHLWHYQMYSESNCSDVCQTNSPFPKVTPPLIISNCSLNITSQYLNCSHRNLFDILDNPCPVVCALDKIRTYNLHSNIISSIQNCTFSRFELLEYLDLSSNQLTSLEPRAFYGLKKLKSLNLWGNNLIMDKNYPPCIFSDLKSLTKLQINRNDPNIKNGGLDYPDQALSYLSKLTDLSMDGQYAKEFGPGFRNLLSLTYLSLEGYLAGYCNIGILTNTTFQNVPYIKDLNIANCFISKVDPFAFSPLRKLVSLNLKHNENIGIKQLPNVFQGLQNITTLRHLNMKLVVNRYSIGICLDHQYLNFFPKHLESLDVQENNIEGIDRSVIRRLSPTLKSLDVSGNRFVFGTYLKDLYLIENLTLLQLNGGSFTYNIPVRYPYQLLRQSSAQGNCTLYGDGAMNRNLSFVLRLPPRLHTIEMNNTGLTYILSRLWVDERNNLTKLSMTGNKFPKLIGPFFGLNSLKILDLSSCYVVEIKSSFFSELSSLEFLNLGGNLLSDFFSKGIEPDLFSSLINLKTLNLTFNDISVLPENIFVGLNKLEILLLYRNPIVRFDVVISHMTNLRELDLDNTRISLLDRAITEHIDNLTTKGQNVTVDLVQCPIMCDCQNLVFLEWMKKSKSVNLSIPYLYRCTYPDMSTKTIKDGYAETIQILERQCRPEEILLFFVGAGTCIMILIIVVSILYRFRWKLRYLYYAAHLFYRGKSPTDEEREYEYDAFISYDSEDEHFVVSKLSPELEKRGLKLCIHGRDFIAGEYIASNIVKAVCASRRMVVVLTRNLIHSYWCDYELQMANMESVHTGRVVLIFLLMEEIPESDLSVEILYNIRNNTYIPYPDSLPDATGMGRLWDKLASDIKK